jgi:Flp pilus assembly protein CpaB
MEVTQKTSPGPEALRRFLATRKGATIVAAGAAVLAGVVLLAFVTNYRKSVNNGTATVPTLVADRLIPKGTSGAVVVSGGLFKPSTVQESQLSVGALADASTLNGKVATHDIYPGQQLTAGDFASNADPLRGELTGAERAISVPLDAAHGLIGDVRKGDHVDVLAGFNASNQSSGIGRAQLRTLLQDVLVLKAPSDNGSKVTGQSSTENIVVRANDKDAAALAFASDNGKVWVVLRPPVGAKQSQPASVTLESLLAGTPAIPVNGSGR